MDYIKQKLSLVPHKPGCYQMKNSDGIIIYVGKAKDLKNRLSSYFRGQHTGKTAKLVSEIVDFEYVVVSTEVESLVLEINLIKKYDPKYNILLRDDKSYPYIEITNEKIPRLKVVRNINKYKNKSRLYGPYPNVKAARKIVDLLNRVYPLRKCENLGKKYCLYYHIHECLGYCENNVDENKIKDMVYEITRFLNGDHSLITKKLNEEMINESNLMHYEKAGEIKELLDYINTVLVKQNVEISNNIDVDVFGYHLDKGYICVQVFFIRYGKILERHYKILPLIDEVSETLTSYIANFYHKDIIIPKNIFVPDIVDSELLSNFLNSNVAIPVKGEKKKILDMANNNAKVLLEEKFELIKKDESRTIDANEQLRKILKLNKLDRIEIFDNSNLFGNYNVSGMVVFINGNPSKNDYRKYKISVDKNDDYGTMREVIYRRYFRVLKDNLTKPDLIIVDGGLGQINVARQIIKDLNLNIMVVGLKKDKHHSTNSLLAFEPIEEINIDKNSNLFYFLERMQDEVHNFTISYHKQIRSKGSLESILDNIEGIGEKRKTILLKKYKTINKIIGAPDEELEKIIPKKIVDSLKTYLNEIS